MAIDEIKRFIEAIHNDPELQDQIKIIGANLEELVRFANQRGFDFSVDDLKKVQSEDMELSEEELDSVSGGIVGAVAIQTLTAFAAAVVCH